MPTYGLLVAAGYLAGALYVYKKSQSLNIGKEQISDIILYAFIFALLGGKLFYVAIFWNDYGLTFFQKAINAAKDFRYGFVFYGGLIMSSLFIYAYSKKKNINFLKLADIFAPALALGHAIGRLGCFFAGCCHGGISNSVFAVKFTNPESMVSPNLLGTSIHPTQLYSGAANFIIFIFLHFALKMSAKREWKNGLIAALYVMLYGISRFTIEFFRGDERGGLILALSPSQILSLSGIIAALIFLCLNNIKPCQKKR